MNPKWMKLAGTLLGVAADEFSNHGCNDWDFPLDWNAEDRAEFVRSLRVWLGDPDAYNADHLPDNVVMSFLAEQLNPDLDIPF